MIVEPGAKVNNEYYCEHFLRRGFLPLHLVTITRHYVRTELSHTDRNTVNFLLQENATLLELDKWQPNSSDFNLVDYAIGCIARKSLPAEENLPQWSSLNWQ